MSRQCRFLPEEAVQAPSWASKGNRFRPRLGAAGEAGCARVDLLSPMRKACRRGAPCGLIVPAPAAAPVLLAGGSCAAASCIDHRGRLLRSSAFVETLLLAAPMKRARSIARPARQRASSLAAHRGGAPHVWNWRGDRLIILRLARRRSTQAESGLASRYFGTGWAKAWQLCAHAQQQTFLPALI